MACLLLIILWKMVKKRKGSAANFSVCSTPSYYALEHRCCSVLFHCLIISLSGFCAYTPITMWILLVIPRCQPCLIVHLCKQKQFAQRFKGHTDCYMVLRILSEPGNNQAFIVSFAGAAACCKQEVRGSSGNQLGCTRKTFSIRPWATLLSQFLGRGTAKALIQRGFIAVFLFRLIYCKRLHRFL